MSAAPLLTLNNGVTMPALGLGVYQSASEETTAAVEAALATGYRHIDTAAVYFNEREVGEGIRRSGVDRSEVFIETKVWITDYGYEKTLHAFDKSAGKLGVDRIDLLILHQPLPSAFDRTIASYRALEKLLADGRVRSIGVSNFTADHIEALLERTEIVPAVNQVELHPYFGQHDVRQAHAKHGILTQAWSPIGGVTFYPDPLGWSAENRTSTLAEPVILGIAETHGRTAAQVMLAWHLQQGRSVIPKSIKPARIAENFDVFDLKLSGEELAALDALDKGVRNGPDPAAVTLETGNWPIPEA
ncbi:aldo/keto reductase [Actinoallomurus soli]|uniref:aldo/keto reductase n=1 Tax=Actinoallomurus soli TaxID=2952535 RepID=UPI002092D0C8|nr:aldo/keto reductase [Actinoallomurus soli]MCO5968912.1 aldo/keto reductase [Actinoallomurus soli]